MFSQAEIVARSVVLPPKKAGIYFLISDADEILYIGQSIDIETRVHAHHRKLKFARWAWLPCPKDETDALERAYITAFNPSLNRDPITITLRGRPEKPAQPRVTWGRPVRTPEGAFETIAAAARHFGVSRQAIWERAARGKNGWELMGARAQRPYQS
jgi:hypothetical protein